MIESTRPNAPHRLHLAGFIFPPVLDENGKQHTALNGEPLYAVPGRVIYTEKVIRHALMQHMGTVPLSRYEALL